MIPAKKLDFWIQNNLNVLLIGTHGIGKTSIIEEAFNRHGLKWRYFSAATMDPWVDFIGVPKEQIDENGQPYLGLVRPAEFQNDEVEVLMFDEFNRAQPKVRNAVMELIQFKSINGRRFNNLRAVWAAINPYDEEETYDVDQLDPAQQDRFHVIYTLPTKPSKEYFTSQYGASLAERAIDWWNLLPDDMKKLVSPRRLDYALDVYKKGGDLSDILDKKVRPKTLKTKLEQVAVEHVSSTDRWLTDSEMFIRELSSRSNTTDVVEAFTALRVLSFDQAVTYVDRLPLAKIKQLCDTQTIGVLVSAFQSQTLSNERTIKMALKSHILTDDLKNKRFQESLVVTEQVSPDLFRAMQAVAKYPSKTEAWTRLILVSEKMMDEQTLTRDHLFMLMVGALDRLKGVSLNSFHSVGALPKKIVAFTMRLFSHNDEHFRSQSAALIAIDPTVFVEVAKCHR